MQDCMIGLRQYMYVDREAGVFVTIAAETMLAGTACYRAARGH